MAALVQTIPQQSGTVSVLQTRPSSASGTFTPASQSSQQQNPRNPTMSWNTYNTGSGSYRTGHQVVAPYAFTTTPNLSNANPQNRQSWSPHLRPEHRTSSAPSVPQGSLTTAHGGVNPRFVNHPAAGSVSTSSSDSSLQSYVSKDDTAIPSRQLRSEPPLRPLSTANLPSPAPSFMNISSPTVAKPSPDRYRRGNKRPEGVAGAQSTATAPNLPGPTLSPGMMENQPTPSVPTQNVPRPRGHIRVSSADDTSRTDKPQTELAKRYRRRSWGNIDNAGLINLQLHLPSSPTPCPGATDYFDPNARPRSPRSSQKEAQESVHSAQSQSSSSSTRESPPAEATSSNKTTSKSDESNQPTKPSPLSQPVSMESSSPNPSAPKPVKESAPSIAPTESLATKRLAEITRNDSKKPGKSRLRRAFSFGSASELLKASSQTNANKREAMALEQARREMLKEELGAEQAAIAEQQEASGLGESIYSHHQGHFFNRSTDNLSVSSTASSASVMLRKMGKGMKRSTRSLVGLFRPKSVMSTTSGDGVIMEPPAPQLSVVNIEADRASVTVNPDPQEMPRGGTVFPKVEPNTADASKGGPGSDADKSRKSIVGGDRERAEVLAAVRKGILKKTYSDIGVSSPAAKVAESSQGVNGSDSPHSSAPSTPEDQSRSSKRGNDGVKIAGEDYFLSAEGRFESKSAPITPQAMAPKSLVFSPRIQFHETWPSGEYDRRGEIATCNRLTPLLAQQIKEELNNFKMEMEVHETSKVYTHFL